METRNATILGLLGGALLVIALAAGAFAAVTLSGPRAAQAQVGGVSMPRQVTVIGQGEVRIAPDQATVQIGVESSAPTTREALDQNSSQTAAIIEQLKQLGVAERDLQTSGFNIYANYNENDGRTVTGYTVSNSVMVTIRDLEQTGALLDQVVAAGANRIYGISFGLSDREAALAQARDAAVTNARERAERLAQGSGANLGSVLVITESIGNAPVMPMPAAMYDEAVGAGRAVPVQAGEQTISAQVQVTYELR